ncbi:MAG: hypothetical protein SFX74_07510 [Fimbriimonadaceae bacterium]|nr:hypothetical protein [Fimbriimonadaceae bacterium]
MLLASVPKIELAVVDQLALIAVLVAAVGFGIFTRRQSRGAFEFFSAGRQLTLPYFVASLVTTWYGGVLGIGESVSYYGLGTWLLLGVPYYVFAAWYAVTFAGRVRDATAVSIPERIRDRFGPVSGRVAGALIFALAVPAAHVLMLGVLVQLLAAVPLAAGCLLALVVGGLLVMQHGLLADVRFGLIAFVLMYTGFGVMVAKNLGVLNQFGTLEPNLRSWTGAQQPLAILSFFILGAWTLVDPGFHQRVASARDTVTSVRGVWIAVGCWLVFDVLTISTGLIALISLRDRPSDPLAIFPALAQQSLPPGLRGVFLAGLVATLLSALVGYLLAAGSAFARDVRGVYAEDESPNAIRVGMVLAGIAAFALAMAVQSVVSLWYGWAGAVVGALLIPAGLAYLRPTATRSDHRTALGMGLAFCAAAAWLIYGVRTNNPLLEVEWLGQRFSLGTLAPGFLISGIVLGWRGRRPTGTNG